MIRSLPNNIMIGPGAVVLDPSVVDGFYAVDNLKALQPQDLSDQKVFLKIAMFVRDLDDERAGFKAKECFEILLNLLYQTETLTQSKPELFRDYLNLLVILKGNFLGLLEYKDVADFLRQQALLAITIPLFYFRDFDFLFNLNDKVASFIQFDVWYLSEEMKKEIIRIFIESLEKNEERLGEESLTIEDKLSRVPIMQYWLLDYNQSAHPSFGKRSSFDRAKYLNTSSFVRRLGSDQKIILEHFLEFYDWLKFEAIDLVKNEGLKKLNQLVAAEKQEQVVGVQKIPSFSRLGSPLTDKETRFVSPPPQPQAGSQENSLQIQGEVEQKKRLVQQIDQKLEELQKKIKK